MTDPTGSTRKAPPTRVRAADQRVALEVEVTRLREAVLDAPHDNACGSVRRVHGGPCDCWKTAALAPAAAASTPHSSPPDAAAAPAPALEKTPLREQRVLTLAEAYTAYEVACAEDLGALDSRLPAAAEALRWALAEVERLLEAASDATHVARVRESESLVTHHLEAHVDCAVVLDAPPSAEV